MFLDEQFYQDPYPEYRKLREAGPIHWLEMFGGAWVLTRHDDIVHAFRDPRLSSERGAVFVDQLDPSATTKLEQLNKISQLFVINRDSTSHKIMRKSLSQAFGRTSLSALRPRLESLASSLLLEIVPGEKFDFMAQYAMPWQAEITFLLLGIEPEGFAKEWLLARSEDMADFFGSIEPPSKTAFQTQKSVLELSAYFRARLPQWREEPPDGLIRYLLQAEASHDEVTEEDVVAQCVFFLLAGHLNSRCFLGNGLLTLLQHPEQLELLMLDNSIYPSAIRELLRYQSPTQFLLRTAAANFSMWGESIKQGETVILLIGSANYDPAQYTDPERLDLKRSEGHCLSLGAGIHACIGGRVAKLEMEMTLNMLFKRFSRLELIDPKPDWGDQFGFRGLNTLPLQSYS